jgi:hypothetical protein
MKTLKFPSWKSCYFQEVFLVTSRYPTGEVKTTKSIGFCTVEQASQVSNPDLTFASISTRLTRSGGTIEVPEAPINAIT